MFNAFLLSSTTSSNLLQRPISKLQLRHIHQLQSKCSSSSSSSPHSPRLPLPPQRLSQAGDQPESCARQAPRPNAAALASVQSASACLAQLVSAKLAVRWLRTLTLIHLLLPARRVPGTAARFRALCQASNTAANCCEVDALVSGSSSRVDVFSLIAQRASSASAPPCRRLGFIEKKGFSRAHVGDMGIGGTKVRTVVILAFLHRMPPVLSVGV